MDLSEQLDAAIGRGPAPPPVTGTLAAGRRALLVRRLATVGAALAVVVVVAVTGALVVPGQPAAEIAPNPAAPPALAPSTGPPERSAGADDRQVVGRMGEVSIEPLRSSLGVRLTTDGRLLAADGATVLKRVDNPLDRDPPAYSAAASVRRGGTTEWHLLERSPEDVLVVASWGPGGPYPSFTDWVEAQVRRDRRTG